MKELSIEEKAKRYDEAIKLAKDSFNYPDYPGFIRADVVFPEIKESKDEKIMKELLAVINDLVLPDEQKSRFIAWLEKQGTDISSFPKEQQVFMKKYVSLDKITLIKLLAERDANNVEIIESFEKQSEQRSIKEHDICNTCDEKASCVIPCPTKLIEQKPADKVEPIFNIGDTIAKKNNSDIHDSGSFTITDITGGKYWYNDRIICDITEQDEWEIYEPVRQKPTEWSEEDEKIVTEIINDVEYAKSINYHSPKENYEYRQNWLKSLKERYTWKPSDEQMKQLGWIAKQNKDNMIGKELMTLYNDLKKLK